VWLPLKPMPPLPVLPPLMHLPAPPLLTPTPAAGQIQQRLHECDRWIRIFAAEYGLPRAALIRMLDRPGALEDEIARWIIQRATQRAHERFAADEGPPTDDDLFSRAIHGVYAQLVARRDAAIAAEKQRQYDETDRILAGIRAGEDIA
jgi:hypothetical protein